MATQHRVVSADDDSAGGGSGPSSDLPPGIVSTGSTTLAGTGVQGTIAAGVTPLGTATVRFEPPGQLPIDAIVSDEDPDAPLLRDVLAEPRR